MPEIKTALAFTSYLKDPIIIALAVYVWMSLKNINRHIHRHCTVLDRLWNRLDVIMDRSNNNSRLSK